MFDNSVSSTTSSSLYRSPEFVAIIFIDEQDQAQPKKDSFSDSEDDEVKTAKASRPGKAPKKILPKSMQSVESKPRLEGVLRWLEDANISDAVIIAPEAQHSYISTHIRSRAKLGTAAFIPGVDEPAASTSTAKDTSKPTLRIDLQRLDDENGDLMHETEALQAWAAKSPYKRADLVILPPDFIYDWGQRNRLPAPPLSSVLDCQRIDENLATTVLLGNVPASDKKQKQPETRTSPLMFAYDRTTSTLLDIRDLEEFEDDVSMRTSLFSRYPIVSLTTSLQLSHIYVCSRHLLLILEDMPHFHSLEEQVIPWLCKAQWQKNLLGRTSRQRSKRSTPGLEDDGEDLQLSSKPVGLLLHSQADALARSTTRAAPVKSAAKSRMKVACIIHKAA